MRNVAMNSTRFDSHISILATEGFITGKHYWEVDVGKKAREDTAPCNLRVALPFGHASIHEAVADMLAAQLK